MTRSQALSGLTAALAFLLVAGGSASAARHDCDAVSDAVQAQVDAACPCDGAATHGKYVQCVARKVRALAACETSTEGVKSCGPVPRACVGKIRRVASRSACGRDGAVTCCLPKQHDCVGDAKPGDGKSDGTCSSSRRKCDQMSDCVIPECQLATSADQCTLVGGTVGRGKNCRSACK
jgi:hypothetical protein